MRTPVLVAILVILAASAGAGVVLLVGPRPVPQARGASVEVAGTLAAILDRLRDLEEARGPVEAAVPDTPAADPAVRDALSGVVPPRGRPGSPLDDPEVRDLVARMQKSMSAGVREKDAALRELQAELTRVKASLPEPEVLRDLRLAETNQLISLAAEVRAEVQRRLLAPPDRLRTSYADFLERKGTGLARILPRGRYDHVVEKRGGGAYWSFATGDNNYDREPDLELQQGKYASGFYGNNTGFFLELGDVPIREVGADVAAPPPLLDGKGLERWRFLWSETPLRDPGSFDAFKAKAAELGLSNRVPAVVGKTYLLRSLLKSEHDLLAVFRTEDEDPHGQNLVWRVLQTWDVPSRR